MSGIFITFEGTDGSGKSTQVKLLHQYLQGRGYQVLCTREPGGTVLGDDIRRILLNPQYMSMCAQTEALLYMAARAQHVSEKIMPALSKGMIVISDRYADSTSVYQGVARKLSVADLKNLNDFATGGLQPDLTILLDGGVEILSARMQKRGQADRIEQEGFVFQQRVRQGFLDLAYRQPQRIKIVSAVGEIADIHQQVIHIISNFLDRREICEDK